MQLTLGLGVAGGYLDWVHIHCCGNGHLGFRFYTWKNGTPLLQGPPPSMPVYPLPRTGTKPLKAKKSKAKAKARRPYS